MSAFVFAQRWWRSFTGGRPPQLPRTAGRGREGNSLRLRVWASFVGRDLPPSRRGMAPTYETSAGLSRPALPGDDPRNQQRASPLAPGWFELPPLLTGGGLTASGSDAVVLETSAPDGRARFLVRRRDGLRPEYSLELVLRDVDAARPTVTAVEYTTADGVGQVLLVPVARGKVGPPASYVRLPGFAVGTAWTASAPAPVTSNTAWDAATVAGSVRAALNEATRDAWRQVAELVRDDLRGVIEGELA
ncbi:hypothetical protein [Streptomyces sp. NPDC055094]